MYGTTRASRVVAKLILTLGLVCLMVAASIAGLRAVPPLPHTLYGSVTPDGALAPDLTRIAVLVSGATTITTTAASGVYTVNVPGNDGDTITFAIYGYEIAETAFWQSGNVQSVDLSNSSFTYNEIAAIDGSTDVSFLAHDGNPGLIINANGHDLGSTEIVVRANQDCTNVAGEAVRRCFYITPTYSLNQDATVTFSFYESHIPAGQTCREPVGPVGSGTGEMVSLAGQESLASLAILVKRGFISEGIIPKTELGAVSYLPCTRCDGFAICVGGRKRLWHRTVPTDDHPR